MRRRAGWTTAIFAASTLLTTGCGALARFERTLEAAGVARFPGAGPEQGRVVRVRGPDGRTGHGAVLDARSVLTVAHVAPVGALEVQPWPGAGWCAARVVRRIPARPEDLVVLEVETADVGLARLVGFEGWDERAVHAPGRGAPSQVQTARGVRPLDATSLRPGDSGSPLLDARGGLVGLLVGRVEGVTPLVAWCPLPGGAPAPPAPPEAAPVVLAGAHPSRPAPRWEATTLAASAPATPARR